MTNRRTSQIERVDAYMRPLTPSPPDPQVREEETKRARHVLLRRGVVASAIALAGLVVSDHYGGLVGTAQHRRVDLALAISGAIVFLIFAITAVRATTNDVLSRVPKRLGDARAASLRLICLLAGYVLVVLGAMSLLRVPVTHLLLGGVLTGVILGIAAQQVLANTFAGLMLLFARPFAVGDAVTIRSGALGGRATGTVTGMTLTYVSMGTDTGVVLLPNNAVLAAAIGPPEWQT
jgi:small-conductance mechanosensitive channel